MKHFLFLILIGLFLSSCEDDIENQSYSLNYISGNNQSWLGGGMPDPMVFQVIENSSNSCVTNLDSHDLEMYAEPTVLYEGALQDYPFNNPENYFGDICNYGGFYYFPSCIGDSLCNSQLVDITMIVYLLESGTVIDTYNLQYQVGHLLKSNS